MKKFAIRAAATAFTLVITLMTACNTDNVIYDDLGPKPVISFDHPDLRYTVKTGRDLTITPVVAHADDNTTYEWLIDNRPVGHELAHTFRFDDPKVYYVTFRATTAAGYDQAELRIEATAPAAPVISLALAGDRVQVLTDSEYTFRPVVKNSGAEGFRLRWLLDGEVVSQAECYTFCRSEEGEYLLTISAVNEDGSDSRDIRIEVVAELPHSVRFAQQSFLQTSTDRSTVAGRPLYLTPILSNFDDPHFAWSVDGVPQQASGRTFAFTADSAGEYRVTVEVSDGSGSYAHAEVKVHCAAAAVSRPTTAASRNTQNRVYEYIPAPGQFINETQTGGFDDSVTNHEAAAAYAESRLAERRFVSLGGFGGSIIVGFDHSIMKRQGADYDFAIQGNAFLSSAGGSNEPGIVWVMQDTNANGLPDDEWYELRGSEFDAAGTIRDYAVTYYRPEGPAMDVQWRDSEGCEGTIPYVKAFHRQDYYYPLWVESDSYTLRGTRLAPRNSEDSSGNWHNAAYEWGYADNFGSDNLAAGGEGGEGQCTGFRIANAVHPDGTSVGLEFIDFVKVQTALNTNSGALGENSTEVFSFRDLSME